MRAIVRTVPVRVEFIVCKAGCVMEVISYMRVGIEIELISPQATNPYDHWKLSLEQIDNMDKDELPSLSDFLRLTERYTMQNPAPKSWPFSSDMLHSYIDPRRFNSK